MRTMMLLALAAGGALPLAGQGLGAAVTQVREGTVRLSFAARAGVCGNGRNNISLRDGGNRGEWASDCEAGPVRLVVERHGGKTTDVRSYVGGQWRGQPTRDLGTVSAPEAARWLLAEAEQGGPAAEDHIFPAILADSFEAWPGLLRIAKNRDAGEKVRKSAVFWLSQAAGEKATEGLDSIVNDPRGDREVRESAVFALSQRPDGEGVPALIRLAKQDRDPEIRKKAMFWLGQSNDPRAVALFEEILGGS